MDRLAASQREAPSLKLFIQWFHKRKSLPDNTNTHTRSLSLSAFLLSLTLSGPLFLFPNLPLVFFSPSFFPCLSFLPSLLSFFLFYLSLFLISLSLSFLTAAIAVFDINNVYQTPVMVIGVFVIAMTTLEVRLGTKHLNGIVIMTRSYIRSDSRVRWTGTALEIEIVLEIISIWGTSAASRGFLGRFWPSSVLAIGPPLIFSNLSRHLACIIRLQIWIKGKENNNVLSNGIGPFDGIA